MNGRAAERESDLRALAAVLARGYLRLAEQSGKSARIQAENLDDSLEVSRQESPDEAGAEPPRRRRCRTT